MLLKNECKQISSVKVKLTFDDGTVKVRLIAIDNLVDVVYNANGMRKHIIGRVSAVSTVGPDPADWYIIIDGSDDFASDRVRFSPATILDCEIVRKGSMEAYIKSPLGDENVPYLRLMKGRLQYSVDGMNWKPVKINEEDIIPIDGDIEPQEGTFPVAPPPGRPRRRPPKPPVDDDNDDDEIVDANY